MWQFEQASGKLFYPSGLLLASGYSGHGIGVNNPLYETVPNVGPIPVGLYTIEAPIDSPEHGPYALPLTPFPANEMFGRSAFLMHGDEILHVGQHLASQGCIIMGPFTRKTVWQSTLDHTLQVVAHRITA